MTTAERLTVGQGLTCPPMTPDEARRALILADRDGKLAAWERLYDTLYPRPAGETPQTARHPAAPDVRVAGLHPTGGAS